MKSGRRRFFAQIGGVSAAAVGRGEGVRTTTPPTTSNPEARRSWIRWLDRVATPVLSHLAAGTLSTHLPVECPQGRVEERRKVTHLEAVGRTLAGVAPWLELAEKPSEELALARRCTDWAREGLSRATDPTSASRLNFQAGAQNLVDAAFLAHGLLRARRTLWEALDSTTQQHVIAALEETRRFKPGRNNWLLFAAMVEVFLARAGAAWRSEPIEDAVRSHELWYKGDGTYGDGPELHWDYYNSYVIQPMLLDVVEQIEPVSRQWASDLPLIRKRAQRYAAIQERLIAPDGSFPVTGRSMAYRCGAFQLLAQMAWRQELPPPLRPAQVRGALSAVIQRTLGTPNTFDAAGWLRIGLAGHQPGLAEPYISTGSLYLCSTVFLPLGLSANAPFWKDPPREWTSRQAWSGKDLPADHALKSET